jgi:hypothetical protein
MCLLVRDSIHNDDVIEPFQHCDNRKPVERRGRKAMDLKLRDLSQQDSQVAGDDATIGFVRSGVPAEGPAGHVLFSR